MDIQAIDAAIERAQRANFIVKGPNGQEHAYPMRAEVVTVGRSDRCDIAVKDTSMSGRHAEICTSDGGIRVRDLGSANGIWLNGQRVEDVELYDGDVLRCGQTSIRVDVPGGRKRPDAGLGPKVLAAIGIGVLLLAVGGIGAGRILKKRAQHRRDVAAVAAFVSAAREGQNTDPCLAAATAIAGVAGTLHSLGSPTCAARPKRGDATRLASRYRDLARACDGVASSISQTATQSSAAAAALTGAAEQIADTDLQDEVMEAQDLVDERLQVAVGFASEWKHVARATNDYAASLEQAFAEGNQAACAAVGKGIAARSPNEIVADCNQRFGEARATVEQKLNELERLTGKE